MTKEQWKKLEKASDYAVIIATLIMLATCIWFNMD